MDNRTEKRKLGDLGENIACEFLARKGFEVLERNYLRKWGEIDIVAKKNDLYRFVEVKTVTWETGEPKPQLELNGSQETSLYRPEDNMHPWKLKRLLRTIQTYLLHKKLECEWQLDLVTVKIDLKTRQARVEMLENLMI